jgi:hypothetical protein
MNLGQLIDPELVSSGAHVDDVPRRQAPLPAMGVVYHSADARSGQLFPMRHDPVFEQGYPARRVREALAKAAGPMAANDVFTAVLLLDERFEIGNVQAALIQLHRNGEADREGSRRAWRYTLNELGRSKL